MNWDAWKAAIEGADTVEQLTDVLAELTRYPTTEDGHVLADLALAKATRLLVARSPLLKRHAVGELLARYEEVPKWYA